MEKVGRTIKRRRKEAKTDYKSRLNLIKSGSQRIVVRKTNRYVIGQLVSSNIAQDRVIVGVNSKNLLKLGWPKEMEGSLKSLSACYLTGFFLGLKAKEKKAIFDIGLQRNVHKSRIFAFLRGCVDAGMEIPHKEDALPSEEIIKNSGKTGEHIENIKKQLEEVKN